MLISSFEAVFKALETNSVLGGLSYLEVIQQALDDVWADDNIARLEQPIPYLTTVDTQTSYTWEEILPSYIDGDGVTTIRRIKGAWDPTVTAQNSDFYSGAYKRDDKAYFNQDDLDNRVYDGDIYIDQERKTIKFESNPGTTTDKWKVDMYLDAPQVSGSDRIPLLKGWERRLLLPGVRAWFEELDNGQPGTQASIFHEQKKKYRDALLREYKKSIKTDALGVQINKDVVIPQ